MPGNGPFSASAEKHEVLRVVGISFTYGSVRVVKDVSFSLHAGEFLTLLGPSGCGKTTLLKTLGGYLPTNGSHLQAGRIYLRDQDVTHAPANRRNLGMVFQNYALFPHLSARDNVAFGLDVRGIARQERDRRVDAMLDRIELSGGERDRYPAELSGGQQQRVALARALIFEPEILLLDEPLANLDRHLREQMRAELRRLQRETGVATVMVTHDQDEALAVSDRIGVMVDGKLLQLGTPVEVYRRPTSVFVAKFLGDANILSAESLGREGRAPFMIRPESIVLGHDTARCSWRRQGSIAGITYLGADLIVEIEISPRQTILARTRPDLAIAVHQTVAVGIHEDDLWRLPEAAGEVS